MKPKINSKTTKTKEVKDSNKEEQFVTADQDHPIKTTLHEHMLMMELRLASQQMKRSCRKSETEMQQLRDRLESLEEQLQKLNNVINKVHDLLICEQNLLYNGYYSVNYKKNLH